MIDFVYALLRHSAGAFPQSEPKLIGVFVSRDRAKHSAERYGGPLLPSYGQALAWVDTTAEGFSYAVVNNELAWEIRRLPVQGERG